jgi:hypothetical protein
MLRGPPRGRLLRASRGEELELAAVAEAGPAHVFIAASSAWKNAPSANAFATRIGPSAALLRALARAACLRAMVFHPPWRCPDA